MVRTDTTTVETLDDTRTERSARAVVFVEEGDAYTVAAVTDRLTAAQNAAAVLDDKLIPRIEPRDDEGEG